LKQLHSYTDQLKSDSLQEELLMTEANYYQTLAEIIFAIIQVLVCDSCIFKDLLFDST
jgi:hypothetical protein